MKKSRTLSSYLLTTGLLIAPLLNMQGDTTAPSGKVKAIMPQKHLDVFIDYCYDCHDTDTQKGKFDIETLSFNISKDIPTAQHWDNVLAALNAKEMPPENKKQIPPELKAELLEDLSNNMVTARNILSDSGGEITMRRLNRREYQNTVEALTGIRPIVKTLPADDGTGGFDTTGSSLFFSSDQFEQYRAIAKETLRVALVNYKKPKSTVLRIEGEDVITKPTQKEADARADTYSRAQAYLSQKEPRRKSPKDFGFRDLQHLEKQHGQAKSVTAVFKDHLDRPEVKNGGILFYGNVPKNIPARIKFRVNSYTPKAKYILRIKAGHYPGSKEMEKYVTYRFHRSNKDTITLGHAKITGTIDSPSIIELPVEYSEPIKGSFSISQRNYQEQASRSYISNQWKLENGLGRPPNIWIDYAELEGPFFEDDEPLTKGHEILPPRSRSESEKSYARKIITNFATKAFRQKPPTTEYLDKLTERYLNISDHSKNEKEAAIDVFSLILSSPNFIYINEPREGDKQQELTQREIAIRLSYFLWSAPPDQQLFDLADKGVLKDPVTLKKQTLRLLADPRAEAFITGFTHQWLDMARLEMFEFQAKHHPDFDEALRQNARKEIYSTVRYLLEQDLPLQNLLNTNFVMVNDVLAEFYGIEGVSGDHFRRVDTSPNSPRGGLLGTAAIHIMGSDGQRASLVERGAWILRHLLNDAPPPAPANVPMLSRLDDKVIGARELQVLHQEEPQCASCHKKIDPVGMGLENFSATGAWRDKEIIWVENDRSLRRKGPPTIHEFDVDASGTFPRGEAFKNFYEYRDQIMHYSEPFSRGFAEQLIAYALGRPYAISDHNLASQLYDEAKIHHNSISDYIVTLVQTKQFKSK